MYEEYDSTLRLDRFFFSPASLGAAVFLAGALVAAGALAAGALEAVEAEKR